MAGSMSVLQQVTAIATIIIAIGLIALVGIAIPVALRIRLLERRIEALLDETRGDLIRIIGSTRAASEDVATVTNSIRQDVGRVQELLQSASDRVEDALQLTERELGEFSALLAVAREEAEALFISAAATVRGVQRGVQRGTRAFRDSRGPDLASDELDAAPRAGDLMTQEEGNGDDNDSESATQTLAAAPRIRPRTRDRRRA